VVVNRQGILFILIGPAGSGKTTLCRRLLNEHERTLGYAVSATTRPPRMGEQDGINYHFLTAEDFHRRREAGDFFETEQNHGYWYGTLRETLLHGIAAGKDLLYQIDIRGALNFKQAFPNNAVLVFLVPPAFGDLETRIRTRGGAEDSEIATRLGSAHREYAALRAAVSGGTQIDYLIVNADLERAYQEINSVVISERLRISRIDPGSIENLESDRNAGEGR
jgi:guanylate kinase